MSINLNKQGPAHKERQAKAAAKRQRKAERRQKAEIISGLDAKLEEERLKQKKIEQDREEELRNLPPRRFYFTIVTEISGAQWERERAPLYALTEAEQEEYLRLKFIDKMNSRPIRSCELVDWGEYKEDSIE